MNSKYKDKLVGVYAPGNYGHTSVLDQTQEFSRWFWSNRKDMELISIKLGIDVKKLNRILTLSRKKSLAIKVLLTNLMTSVRESAESTKTRSPSLNLN